MVLRFGAVRNVKGTLRQRFSVVLALPQATVNQQYKAALVALSFLSPFLYLKTVATPHAILYNSAQPVARCPRVSQQKLKDACALVVEQ
jgi:hypothetical protein